MGQVYATLENMDFFRLLNRGFTLIYEEIFVLHVVHSFLVNILIVYSYASSRQINVSITNTF